MISMIFVAASLLVTAGDVLPCHKYEMKTDAVRREILLTLDEEDAKRLSTLAAQAPDHKLAIIVDGVVVQMPRVKTPLSGRGVSLTFPDSASFQAAKAAFSK